MSIIDRGSRVLNVYCNSPIGPATEGLRAINILDSNELAEHDPMPQDFFLKIGPFYYIANGAGVSTPRSFSGVFTDP